MSIRARSEVCFALCIASLALSGCPEPEGLQGGDAGDASVGMMDASIGPFDPRGDDVALYGDWNVNGDVPSVASCAEAGIDTIELVFLDPLTHAEYSDASFRFPCTLEFYETAPERVLAAGTYEYQWRAYAGEVMVLQSRRFSATVAVGAELELQRVDFQRRVPIAMHVAFTWEGAEGAPTTCGGAGVNAGYAYRLYRGADVANAVLVPGYASIGTVACADSLTMNESPLGSLPSGAYVLEVEGWSSASEHWQERCAIEIPLGGSVSVECSVVREP